MSVSALPLSSGLRFSCWGWFCSITGLTGLRRVKLVSQYSTGKKHQAADNLPSTQRKSFFFFSLKVLGLQQWASSLKIAQKATFADYLNLQIPAASRLGSKPVCEFSGLLQPHSFLVASFPAGISLHWTLPELPYTFSFYTHLPATLYVFLCLCQQLAGKLLEALQGKPGYSSAHSHRS